MPSRQYPDRRPKSSHGRSSPMKKGRSSERRSPPINKEYVIGEVNDAMDAQFNGMYSWEDMLRDSGLNKAEQKWAKEHLHYRIVEMGVPSVSRPAISQETFSAAEEYVENLEGEMHGGNMSSNSDEAESGLAALKELVKAAKKSGLVDQDTEYDKELQQAGSVEDAKRLPGSY